MDYVGKILDTKYLAVPHTIFFLINLRICGKIIPDNYKWILMRRYAENGQLFKPGQ